MTRVDKTLHGGLEVNYILLRMQLSTRLTPFYFLKYSGPTRPRLVCPESLTFLCVCDAVEHC